MGTPKVESLASYVYRLAEAHSVSVASLCRHVIVPEIGLEDHGKGLRYISSSGYLVNGSGKVAQDWLGAVSRLTVHVSLAGTNLLPLQEVVTPKQLFRKNAAWCPLCLEDRLGSPDGPFESLVWSFRAVKYCPEHSVWLSEICPYCGSEVKYFTANRRVGCCPDCLRWLGGKYISVPASLQGEDPDIYRQISEIVGKLLAGLPDLKSRVTPEFLSKGIQKAVLVCFDGTLTRFSEAIGKRKGAVSAWRSGTVTPSFQELVRISCVTGISLKGLMMGEFDGATFKPLLDFWGLPEKIVSRRSYRNHESVVLEKALTESLGEILPRSIASICKDVGLPARYAWKNFPDLAKAVSERRKEALSHSQSQREELIKGEICLAVADLQATGVYPSLRKITQRISRKAKLRKDQNRSFWEREIEKSHNYGVLAESEGKSY